MLWNGYFLAFQSKNPTEKMVGVLEMYLFMLVSDTV